MMFSSVPPSNSLIPVYNPGRAFGVDMVSLKGPGTRLLRCFWIFRYIRTMPGVLGWVRRSQDTVKNKP